MKYTIRELEAFSVIGQEVELTNYEKRNIQISTRFWRKFNDNLKKSYLSQSGNWIKYMKPAERFIKKYYSIRSIPLQENFLHFERYDYRFYWNRENSRRLARICSLSAKESDSLKVLPLFFVASCPCNMLMYGKEAKNENKR